MTIMTPNPRTSLRPGSTAESRSRIPARVGTPAALVTRPDGNSASQQQVLEALATLENWTACVHRAAAQTYLLQDMYAEAIVHIEAACRFDPDNAEYHNECGTLRYLTGDDLGALAGFDAALQIDAGSSISWFNRGMVLFGLNRLNEAEDAFNRSILHDDKIAESWNNLGVVRHRLGRRDDARICFEKALSLDPNNQDARENLRNLG